MLSAFVLVGQSVVCGWHGVGLFALKQPLLRYRQDCSSEPQVAVGAVSASCTLPSPMEVAQVTPPHLKAPRPHPAMGCFSPALIAAQDPGCLLSTI